MEAAVDSQGTAIIVWTEPLAGNQYQVKAVVVSPGQASCVPENISPVTDGTAGPVTIAIDSTGLPTVVWVGNDTNQLIYASSRVNDAWEAPQILSPDTGSFSDPHLDVDLLGDAAVSFAGTNDGGRGAWIAERSAGGAWVAPTLLSGASSNRVGSTALAMDAGGDAVVLWDQEANFGSLPDALVSRRRSGGQAAFDAVAPLFTTTPGDLIEMAAVGTASPQSGPQGVVTALWVTGDMTLHWNERPFGFSWQAAGVLSQDAIVVPQLAANGLGRVVAVWNTLGTMRYADRVVGLPWNAVADVPGAAAQHVGVPQDLALDDAENPTLVWQQDEPQGVRRVHSHGTLANAPKIPGSCVLAVGPTTSTTTSTSSTTTTTMPGCDGLTDAAGLTCRCTAGLAPDACGAASLPGSITRGFTSACGAAGKAEVTGPGRKGRKQLRATLAALGKAGRGLTSKAGRKLSTSCQAALATVLGATKADAKSLLGKF